VNRLVVASTGQLASSMTDAIRFQPAISKDCIIYRARWHNEGMTEPGVLALGAVVVAALFSICIKRFDIVVSARDFSDEYELLCTQLWCFRSF
jgi:hypothetical protein